MGGNLIMKAKQLVCPEDAENKELWEQEWAKKGTEFAEWLKPHFDLPGDICGWSRDGYGGVKVAMGFKIYTITSGQWAFIDRKGRVEIMSDEDFIQMKQQMKEFLND